MVVAAVVELTSAFGLPGTEHVHYSKWCTADYDHWSKLACWYQTLLLLVIAVMERL